MFATMGEPASAAAPDPMLTQGQILPINVRPSSEAALEGYHPTTTRGRCDSGKSEFRKRA
jgi:hypothetical protein